MRGRREALGDNSPSLDFVGCKHLLDSAGLRGPILANEAKILIRASMQKTQDD